MSFLSASASDMNFCCAWSWDNTLSCKRNVVDRISSPCKDDDKDEGGDKDGGSVRVQVFIKL